MAEPTWKAVADALATRMANHAYCPDHAETEAQPDDCPFCHDRAVYRLWQRKSGKSPRPAASPARRGTPSWPAGGGATRSAPSPE